MNVLIVDDTLYMRRLLQKAIGLIFPEINCYCAGNDQTAISIAKEYLPEMITLDLTMPGMGGERLITKLLDASPHSRVCVISAIFYEEIQKEMKEKGAWRFLSKPVNLEDLKNTINECLKAPKPLVPQPY